MADNQLRKARHRRIRKKVFGTTERPRLSVHFSSRNITAQLIDDTAGVTLAAVNTTEKEVRQQVGAQPNAGAAAKVGKLIAERAASKNIAKIVFDRGGYRYHGKVKALADAAREAGFDF